ncbi:RHS repeat domain-containing protein, partial [Nocardioides sp. AN3]
MHYLDVNGREIDNAGFGQADASDGTGHWQIASTQFDANGALVWQLSAGNRSQALAPSANTDTAVAGTTASAERADLLASITVYDPLDPAKVTDTFGPTHPVTLASGTLVHGRVHVHTDYDEGAPYTGTNPATNAAYRLPTTETSTVFDVETQADVTTAADKSVETSGYAAVGGMSKTGWELEVPTTSTVRMGADPTVTSAADLVTTTVYDNDGRVIEERLSGDATGDADGTSPRSTKTTYYVASGFGDCVSALSAGLVCKTGPGGQPGGTSKPLPTTSVIYDQYGNPTVTTEIYSASGSGGTGVPTRTTTTDYDSAGRVTQTAVTTANVTGNHPVPAVSYGYSDTTGRQISQSTGTGGAKKTLTTSYDAAGQVSSYTYSTGVANSNPETTYTGYDIDGRAVSKVDLKGATTWTYDSSSEHRSLVTAVKHAPSPVSTESLGSTGAKDADGNLDITSATGEFGFTAAYDASGAEAVQSYPNGLDASTAYDNAGNTKSLSYAKAGTTWMSFTQTNGTGERITAQSSTVGGQAASSQAFIYDNAGRLTQVQDTVGPAMSGSG